MLKQADHYQIRKPVVSYHEHNEAARAEELVRRAAEGACIAVVSDAGLPAIADAGYRVVTLAIARGVPVVPPTLIQELLGPKDLKTAMNVAEPRAGRAQFLGSTAEAWVQRERSRDPVDHPRLRWAATCGTTPENVSAHGRER